MSRRAKSKRELARKKGTRKPRKKILIVCEGSKTEPIYWDEVRTLLRTPSTSIEICGPECQSDPVAVAKYAIRRQRAAGGDPYDRIFCVVDGDVLPRLRAALMDRRYSECSFIVSSPCFEYWILCHFEGTNSPFVECRDVISRIRLARNFPGYRKNNRTDIQQLISRIDQAAENIDHIRRLDIDDELVPFSTADHLVDLLRSES